MPRGYPAWLSGPGEMRERVRNFDWDATPLGSASDWAAELRTAVGVCLGLGTPACVFWGPNSIQIYNDAYTQVLLRKHPDYLGRTVYDTWPERVTEMRPLFARVLAGESVFEEEQPWILDREGTLQTYSFSLSLTPIRDRDGKVLGIFHTAQEVMESAVARRLQRARELSTVFESMPDAVYIGNRDGISYCNREALEMLGASSIEDLQANIGELGRRFAVRSIATGQLIPEEKLSFMRALTTGRTVIEDVMATRGDTGETVYIRGASAPILDNGQVVGAVAINTDVTDRYKALEALRESQEKLELALQRTNQGTWFFDPEEGILHADEGVMRICGSKQSSGTLQYWLGLIHPDDRARVDAEFRAALAGLREYEAEYRLVRDGETRWVRSRGHLLTTSRGMRRLFAIVEDISMRKLTEIALRHSEKMAETGRLATSIAHEINNPLESITNLIYLAQRTDKPATVREYLKSAEKELQRVSVIANQTLRFYKQSVHPASVSSDELLDSVIAIHQGRLMQTHVTLEKRNRSTVPLLCFEGEIRQVLSNLIGNAIAAAAMRGRHIWARSREGVDWKTGRKGIVFTIADNGCGIPAANLVHIFEAFFTTKGSEGNGLGLWISHEIVTRHHGFFHLRTRENRGSVFSFFLPFAAATR